MKIFLSYRRDDSAGHAGRLFDYLTAHFGDKSVFMDIDTIEPGEDFRAAVANAVGACDVALVMIGKHWLNILDAQGRRRLDNPQDFVRAEIASALASPRVRVIPVLVRGASMPGEHELPDDLKELTWRNAIELSDSRFQHDARKLIEVVERAGVKPSKGSTRRRPGTGAAGYRGVILGMIALGLIVGMASYGLQALASSRTPTPGAPAASTMAPTSTSRPASLPASPPTTSPTPSPEPTADAEQLVVQLIDDYYTCINSATRDLRADYVECWDLLSDRAGEYQFNLTANSGGIEAFINYWNDFKVSYALYYCFDRGQHFVDAEYYHHYWDDLSRTAGGKNLIEYSFALGSDGWRIVGGKVLTGNISPYCDPFPRIDRLSLFP